MTRDALEMRLTGELELSRNGHATALPASRKTRALLGYLVVTGKPHLRENLCDLLWDGPDDPRASLRWSLAKLRPLVDDPGALRLLADRTHVAFEAGDAQIDLLRARALLTAGVEGASVDALRRAAALMRGELLDGLDLTGSYRFHEWLVCERENVRTLRISVLDALVEKLRSQNAEEALRHARARLAIEPLSEAAHAAVTRSLAGLGRLADAHAQIEKCRRILEIELGTKPSWILESARLGLAEGSVAEPAPGRDRSDPPPKGVSTIADPVSEVAGTIRLSLIGREPERILIERHVAEATAGAGGRVLALLGEPGIGKSRLLEELRARVNAAGGVVLGGRAESAEMIRPYGAFIDALRGLPRERLKHVPPALRWLIPELADVPRDSDADRTQLFDALVTFMRTLAGSAPAALVIDDVQWVDEASAALFHYAARELSGGRVVFAIGARPAELADNRAASRMLRALSRDGRLTELALGPLDALGVRALATAAGAADLEAVSSMSGGNPLFAIELSRSTTPNEVPRSLNAVLSERLERLDPRALSILPWAAALGGAFEASLLAQVTASAGLELVDALADLERQGVLREMPSGFDVVAYDFAHDLIRRAAYRTLSEPRRRVVHLTIARALSQAPDLGGALSVDIAHHAALGGDPELAARACVTAGERSLRLFAREEAEAFALRGLTLAERVSEPARLRLSIALLKLRVEARTASSRSSDIEAALTRAGSLATASGLETDAATAFYALTMHRHWCGDHAGAHRDSLIAAERAKGATPLARARVFANAGACLAELERESQRARTLLLEAQGLVDSEGGDDLADIWLGLALLLHMEGRIEEARPLAERALAIARTTEDEWRQFWALRRLAMMDIEALRFDSASRRTEAMAELATRTGDGSEKAIAEALEAVAKLGRDEPSAPEALVRSSAHLACVDAKAMLAYAQLFAAETHLAKGDHERAKLAAEVALGAAETLGQGNLVALAHAALGRAARARGDDRAEREHGGASLLAMGSGPEEPTARARAAVAALTVRPGAEREPLKVAGAPISTDTKTVASTQSVHLRKNPGGRHGSHRRRTGL